MIKYEQWQGKLGCHLAYLALALGKIQGFLIDKLTVYIVHYFHWLEHWLVRLRLESEFLRRSNYLHSIPWPTLNSKQQFRVVGLNDLSEKRDQFQIKPIITTGETVTAVTVVILGYEDFFSAITANAKEQNKTLSNPLSKVQGWNFSLLQLNWKFIPQSKVIPF